MTDPWRGFRRHQHDVATDAFAIVPDDDADLARVPRVITVAEAGTVAVITLDGTELTLVCPAGAQVPLRVRRVLATGTDASGIVGLE